MKPEEFQRRTDEFSSKYEGALRKLERDHQQKLEQIRRREKNAIALVIAVSVLILLIPLVRWSFFRYASTEKASQELREGQKP